MKLLKSAKVIAAKKKKNTCLSLWSLFSRMLRKQFQDTLIDFVSTTSLSLDMNAHMHENICISK